MEIGGENYNKIIYRGQDTQITGCQPCILNEDKENENYERITIYSSNPLELTKKNGDRCRICKQQGVIRKLAQGQEMFNLSRLSKTPLSEIKTVERLTKKEITGRKKDI